MSKKKNWILGIVLVSIVSVAVWWTLLRPDTILSYELDPNKESFIDGNKLFYAKVVIKHLRNRRDVFNGTYIEDAHTKTFVPCILIGGFFEKGEKQPELGTSDSFHWHYCYPYSGGIDLTKEVLLQDSFKGGDFTFHWIESPDLEDQHWVSHHRIVEAKLILKKDSADKIEVEYLRRSRKMDWDNSVGKLKEPEDKEETETFKLYLVLMPN